MIPKFFTPDTSIKEEKLGQWRRSVLWYHKRSSTKVIIDVWLLIQMQRLLVMSITSTVHSMQMQNIVYILHQSVLPGITLILLEDVINSFIKLPWNTMKVSLHQLHVCWSLVYIWPYVPYSVELPLKFFSKWIFWEFLFILLL